MAPSDSMPNKEDMDEKLQNLRDKEDDELQQEPRSEETTVDDELNNNNEAKDRDETSRELEKEKDEINKVDGYQFFNWSSLLMQNPDDQTNDETESSLRRSTRAKQAQLPDPTAALRCPRCDSTNTKFCYFNNYSLSQPRHFCKACQRYWTRGGALRNVPAGGKNKGLG